MHEIFENYRYFLNKRYSTISGTLVYFLLMSVTPFLFWVALLAGNVDFAAIMPEEVFSAVSPILNYLQSAAHNATGSAGIILLLTSLWSSTNFFYHLKRSGEIIFDTEAPKSGIKLRLKSLLAVFGAIFLIALAAAVPIFTSGVLTIIMPVYLAQSITIIFLIMFAFFIAYFLNVFACPYRLGFENTVGGVTLTVLLWIFFAIGFSFYMRFANPQRLYGAIATIIVFLLWSYLMINSLVVGIIYNSRYSPVRGEKTKTLKLINY